MAIYLGSHFKRYMPVFPVYTGPAPVAPAYAQRIRDLFGSAVVSYLPLSEPSGLAALDYSGNNRAGAYSESGVTLGETGIGDGLTAAYFNTGSCNWLSDSLVGAFNGLEGALLLWVKANNAALWTDGISRYLVYLFADASNLLLIDRVGSADGRLRFYYRGGGVAKSILVNGLSSADWMHISLTWSRSSGSSGEVKAYIDAAQQGETQTGLGTWSGALVNAVLGAADTVPSSPWLGWLGHGLLLSRPATAAELGEVITVS